MHSLDDFFLLLFGHCGCNKSFWLFGFLLFLLLLLIGLKLIFEVFIINFFLFLFLLIQEIFFHLLLQLLVNNNLADSLFIISHFIRFSYRMHSRFPISILSFKLGHSLFLSRKFLEQFSILLVQLIEVWFPLAFKCLFLFYLFTYLFLQRLNVFSRIGKIGLASIRPSIFYYQMILPDLTLNLCDLCCLLSIMMHHFCESFQKLLLVILIWQISLQSFLLISFAFSQYIPLVNQLGAYLFCYFQVVLFVDNILHIILGPLQPKTFNSCSQLPHEPLLHGQLLQKRLVWIFQELFFYGSSPFETGYLGVYEFELLSKTGVLLYQSASIFGVLVVCGAAQLHPFYLIYQHLLSK